MFTSCDTSSEVALSSIFVYHFITSVNCVYSTFNVQLLLYILTYEFLLFSCEGWGM
uniref:Uncharacterized protein n=1 Tax=Arundo donax TaxID=35708 RepID=A0A0A9EKA9_ARUDO